MVTDDNINNDLTLESDLQAPLLSTNQSGIEEGNVNQGEATEGPPPLLKLLFFKVLYFFQGLSASSWGRFGIIYYNKVKHLTPAQIGVLTGAMPLLSFVTQPLWGAIADRIHSRKFVYVGCKLLSTCSLLGLSLSFIDSFWRVFGCVTGMAIFRANGVLDAHTIDFLGDANRGLYGTIRVWTAVSWGLGAVIMGYITDHYGFELTFWLYGTMCFSMLLFVSFGLSSRSSSELANFNNPITSRPRPEVLWRALFRLPIALWLAEVAWIGAAMSLVDSFLFVYLQNDLQASTVLCGWTAGVTVLFELPIFWSSRYLLDKVGHDRLFLLALFAYATRVIGYTLLQKDTVYWVLPLEILHGITFASMWIASVDYSAALAPKEWSTTVQSILSTFLNCVGGGIGPILGGLVVKEYGFLVLYRVSGCITAIVFFIHTGMWLHGRGHDAFLESLTQEDAGNEAVEPLVAPVLTQRVFASSREGSDDDEVKS